MSFQQERKLPTVLIAGGGIGGLMLGLLLERIDVPYFIFERAAEVNPIGSVMTLGANILPVFEQLGMLGEIEKIALPFHTMDLYNGRLRKLGSIDLKSRKRLTGYHSLIFSRPRFYDVLLRHIPVFRVKMGKKVLRTEERDNKVHIYCSDNTTYEGDILVGADGPYSGVRQSLYRQMVEQDALQTYTDLEDFTIGYVTLVGVAKPRNPAKYPQLKDKFSHYSQVLGGNNRSWGLFSVADNQICWALSIQLSPEEAKAQHFRNSEWGPEASDAMIREYRSLPCPWGGTMGEIFDASPRDQIAKVFLEEKLFKTWYHSRTVLLGDACHKMLPGAGVGATNAMQDAVVLANCIYNMQDSSLRSVTAVFEEYYEQRYHHADLQFQRSSVMSKLMAGQTWSERLARHVLFNYTPSWVQQRGFAKSFEYRPQISWMPLVENRAALVVYSTSSRKEEHFLRAELESILWW